MRKNEDKMEANMEALAKQKVLDQEKREKVSKKRTFEDISDFNEERDQREQLNKRVKVSVPAPPQQQQQQQQAQPHQPAFGSAQNDPAADLEMSVQGSPKKRGRPSGKSSQKKAGKSPTHDIREQLNATNLDGVQGFSIGPQKCTTRPKRN